MSTRTDGHPSDGYQILRSLRQILRRVSTHSRSLATKTGLTVPQLLLLRAVRSLPTGGVTVAAVADEIHLSRSTVSALVERMVQGGLLTRERSTTDRRRVELALTTQAERKLLDTPQPLQDAFLRRLDALEPEHRHRLVSALEEVAQLMGADELDVPAVLAAPRQG